MAAKSQEKIPIVVLIGGGSKLPALINASKDPKNKFKISLVVSHKKVSPGIDLALKNNIPAVFFNLPDYRARIAGGADNARANYCQILGWFISQQEYLPKLLVFAGWDLIMDNNFFKFFISNIGNGYSAINLHPGLMAIGSEKNEIILPDKSTTPVIKGEQQEVLETVLRKKYTYFGPSVHFMNPKNFDEGQVIIREFIPVEKAKTVKELQTKLMPVEDRILTQAIEKVLNSL